MTRAPELRMSSDEFRELARGLAGAPRPPRPTAGVPLPIGLDVVALGEGPAEPGRPDPAPPGRPAPYRLSQWTDGPGDWTATNDRLEIDVHGATAMTHLDTIAHFRWDAVPGLRREGDDPLAALARRPLVARGILIDVPGILGPPPAGAVITRSDVDAALDRCGLEPRPGDVLHLHFGRRSGRRSDVPLGAEPMRGLGIECAEWLAGIGFAAVVTDEGLDPVPSEVEGFPTPWHLLLLTVLGVPLVDLARLDELSAACRHHGRWDFTSVIAPLPVPGASGSPVNPVAIF